MGLRPMAPAFSEGDLVAMGRRQDGFSCPFGSNSAQPELKHRTSWQQKLRGKTKEVLFCGTHTSAQREGNPPGQRRERGALFVLPRTHPRPLKWNRFSLQTTLPGFQSPVNSFFLHFVPSMILFHLTSTPKPSPHTS